MDLYEYQARDLFESHGVPVLGGAVATTPDEAEKAAAKIGGRVVVKAQVKVGGRGKAGGVKLAEDAADARVKAEAILGMDIKGHTVHQVMIAEAAPIEAEYYLAAGNVRRALAGVQIYRNSLDISSSLPDVMDLELRCLVELKRQREAEALATEILKEFPNSPAGERAKKVLGKE